MNPMGTSGERRDGGAKHERRRIYYTASSTQYERSSLVVDCSLDVVCTGRSLVSTESDSVQRTTRLLDSIFSVWEVVAC